MARKNLLDLSGILVPQKERERRAQRQRRAAARKIKRQEVGIAQRHRQAQSNRRQHWEDAKRERRSGDRAAAQRALSLYKQSMSMEDLLHRRISYLQALNIKIEIQQGDQELVTALDDVVKGIGVDVDEAHEVLDRFAEAVEAGQELDVVISSTLDGVLAADADSGEALPSEEELLKALDSEILAETEGAAGKRTTESEIEELRKRLNRVNVQDS